MILKLFFRTVNQVQIHPHASVLPVVKGSNNIKNLRNIYNFEKYNKNNCFIILLNVALHQCGVWDYDLLYSLLSDFVGTDATTNPLNRLRI